MGTVTIEQARLAAAFAAAGQGPPPLGDRCPHAVERPAMLQDWDDLTFLSWPVATTDVDRLLPRGLRCDLDAAGRAWVSLIPFRLRARPVRRPGPPWLGTFGEVNVRTYVIGPDGPGIYFLSLHAPRAAVCLAARAWYRIPYRWARVIVQSDGRRRLVACSTHRGDARTLVEVEVGDPIPRPDRLTVWLTARWRLYGSAGGTLCTARVEHAPWELREAAVLRLADSLVVAAGLPHPSGPPLVQHSLHTAARVGRPRRIPG